MAAQSFTPPGFLNERPDCIQEVFLNPGGFHFGGADTRIVTLLGSCVSITLWHPRLRMGGMCHFMLPSRGVIPEGGSYDGRYGDEAMKMFMGHIMRVAAEPEEFQAKLFGGANMFADIAQRREANVGERNIEMGLAQLERYGIPLIAKHLGGESHRKLMLDVWSGDVWLKQQGVSPSEMERARGRK
ncbi:MULTISPECIES: chemotaxis protein CheD [unclassified Uliginosibacterium]|uniref:chemotaxis protein CheD n=1 Tax=unclassified Uliginosibacterium TaxID=2621521 RepID=UPI000C7CE5C8|nr:MULTISPECIES: chemotaxis protein CheD [unclassified Uliginosibacterium]MDO6385824.1 chemotaxis protein CheD [Uliginosibacterium sp. 31-12]PLK49837.1 chemotaxis protein CheD [Uliginosibacterium sp. TH139]